jgi:signal peptidase I
LSDPGLAATDERTVEAQPTERPTGAPEDRTTEKKGSILRELPVLVVIAFAVALLIKSFVLQAFFIPSASMEPTLREGDRVLVEKLSYLVSGPQRGQVIVFEKDITGAVVVDPDPSWTDTLTDSLKGLFGFPSGDTQDFIKRVMAVGGDTIEGREDGVYVNGEIVDEPYLEEGQTTGVFGPFTVPDNHVFVMGDNRDNSDDSRGFGAVPEDRVVGHAFVLIWPPADVDTL